MQITAITAQKKNKNRCNIFIDDNFFCGLERITVLTNRLAVGLEITTERLEDIQLESECNTAFARAITYLGSRMRTEREVRTKLASQGYVDKVADKVVLRLKEYNYVNDDNLARVYVSDKKNSCGSKKLRADLYRLGADKNSIDKAIETVGSQEASAIAMAQKYLRTHPKGARTAITLSSYLYRRGFGGEDISSAMRSVGIDMYEDN